MVLLRIFLSINLFKLCSVILEFLQAFTVSFLRKYKLIACDLIRLM